MERLAIDLFCGLGGWAEGFLAEDYDVVGFDIERRPYPGDLVLQDVITLDGAQFKDAAVIVASPPCQAYSYMAMPWKRAKRMAEEIREGGHYHLMRLNLLFDACFRIQREASAAADRDIPMVVENVKGAQPWVGKALAHYGSYYLWGDVDSLGGKIVVGGLRPENVLAVPTVNGIKHHDTGAEWWRTSHGQFSSRSEARKHASAVMAKIPLRLARHVARCFKNKGQG